MTRERPSVADGLMATAALLALAVTLLFVVKITADGITTGPGANPLGP